MLVLSRTEGTAIQIGPDVTVSILEIRGHQVRVGITAADHLRIVRTELFDVKQLPPSGIVPDGTGNGGLIC